MDADKFLKLRDSAITHEDPLCKLFIDKGVPAHRNRDLSTQKSHGDVILTFTDGSHRSIELTKSEEYTSCSYTAHKPREYVGIGKPEHAYCLFSCLQKEGKPDMVHFMCQAAPLHAIILADEEYFFRKSPERKFYVVTPNDLLSLPEACLVTAGNSLAQVVERFLDVLHEFE